MCVLSFLIFSDCSYEKLGVWLLKNANSTHQIVITRNMQPEKPICFVPHTDDCTNGM